MSGKEDDFFFNLKNVWSDRILRYSRVAPLTDDILVMTGRKKYNRGKTIKPGGTSMRLRSPSKLMRRMQDITRVLIST